MPKGDRDNKTPLIMTHEEIVRHNNAIIKKYGVCSKLTLYGYISSRITSYLRLIVLRRDRFKCLDCGINGLENLDIDFDIHHVIPTKDGGINHADNLITLCEKCHVKRHKGEKKSDK